MHIDRLTSWAECKSTTETKNNYDFIEKNEEYLIQTKNR